MEHLDQLRMHGLFDAKVPRYTSYPPANHFEEAKGQPLQRAWLEAVPVGSDISVYIHIPFCRRLCWFCACRTQGTKTLRPVEAYVETLRREIWAVQDSMPAGVRMGRLHLGGGTPTILSPRMLEALLGDVFESFPLGNDFEFSVEIDPTDASDDVLETLVQFGLTRASLGVQDFAPVVQAAIGRTQTLDQTLSVIAFLRDRGVMALNLDLLYGLPHQTEQSFRQTLEAVVAMQADRLAIYGYAHVPWMSKRQVMIRDDALPSPKARFALDGLAHDVLERAGYRSVGIDHFARPTDALYLAQEKGRVRRNFQGYTDDPHETLIGLGASAISRFRQGYVQNAVATSAYQDRIADTGLAAQKGYAVTQQDRVIGQMIEDLLCRFNIDAIRLREAFPDQHDLILAVTHRLQQDFPDVFLIRRDGLEIRHWARSLVRIVASRIDGFSRSQGAHSVAI